MKRRTVSRQLDRLGLNRLHLAYNNLVENTARLSIILRGPRSSASQLLVRHVLGALLIVSAGAQIADSWAQDEKCQLRLACGLELEVQKEERSADF